MISKPNYEDCMNVLCATDDNYAPYCGIMLTSLLENNKDRHINIFVIASRISTKNQNRIYELVKRYNCTIQIVEPDLSLFSNCPIKEGDHVSLATYYRFLCGTLLPSDVHRILYLDCDIIVNTDLRDLYEMDLDTNIAAACIDSYSSHHRKRLSLGCEYVCAGVMLLDIDLFRADDIEHHCFEIVKEKYEQLLYHDQDVLNIVIGNRIKHISPKYNMMSAFLRKEKADLEMRKEFAKQIIETLEKEGDNLIIHYEYLPKPWQKWVMMPHPFTKLWYRYRKRSPWPDAPIDRKAPLKLKLNVLLLRLLWNVGIKKRPDYYLV